MCGLVFPYLTYFIYINIYINIYSIYYICYIYIYILFIIYNIYLTQVGLELTHLLTTRHKFVGFDVISRVDIDCARSLLCHSR